MHDLLFVAKRNENTFLATRGCLIQSPIAWSVNSKQIIDLSWESNIYNRLRTYFHLYHFAFPKSRNCDDVFSLSLAFVDWICLVCLFFLLNSRFFLSHIFLSPFARHSFLRLSFLEPVFVTCCKSYKSSTKRFWDISISPHHIILSSWITTNLSCFSSLSLPSCSTNWILDSIRSAFALIFCRFARLWQTECLRFCEK